MSARTFSERDIHLALDGELPADERAGFDAWLAAHPDMAAANQRFFGDLVSIRSAVAGVLDEPVPARLSADWAKDEPVRRFPGSIAWWRAAAAAGLLVAGLACGYGIGASDWTKGSGTGLVLADHAIAAHDVFAAEKLHVVEVGADQRDHLLGWLSKRIGLTLVAPDLSAQGYELVGGRLLPEQSRSAAQFMYQNGDGTRISLYVVSDPQKGDTGFRYVEENGTGALYWLDDGYGCAVAGTVPQATLTAIATAAYKQLLWGMKS